MPRMHRDDPRHGPMDEEVRASANRIGKLIGDVLPPEYGFALLIFGVGDSAGRMNYISNAKRDEMIVALKELIARFEGRYTEDQGHA